jgi:crossover junction endodeoxyribonuclease RuvC
MPIIIGIDPGSNVTGYGIIDSNGIKYQYLASGFLRLQGEYYQKLQQVYDAITKIMSQYQPDEAAIEEVFVHANANSALKLGQARGAALVALAQGNIKIAEYPTRKIKQAIVGYGGAEKLQVAQMVKLLLKLSQLPQADEADALAVAICHANSRKVNLK